MNSLMPIIVELLRNGSLPKPPKSPPQYDRGMALPRAVEPKHGGRAYDDIITEMERGR